MPKKRKHKNIPLEPVFHIFCEGEKTEPYYLNGFINEYFSEKRNVVVVEKSKKNTPVQLVEEAISEKSGYGDNDEIWVVYDRESSSKYPEKLHKEARDKALKNNINIAFSSVCFEQWVLLHFSCSAKSYSCYDDLKNTSPLKKELAKVGIKDYDKSLPSLFDKIKNFLPQAILNSKTINNSAKNSSTARKNKPYHFNPYTDVYKLLEKIEDFCKK